MNSLHKQLLLNILNAYYGVLSNNGCNDLYPDDPLLVNISAKELEELKKEFAVADREFCADYDLVNAAKRIVNNL